MKIKFVFIVLHYLALDMTKECVGTLFSSFVNTQNFKIVIVDNASPNGSGQALKELYSNNQFVDVLLNNENLGFAKGNNVGYVYAKKKYNPDYIIAMNNDVLVQDVNFFNKIEDLYSEYNYAVLGPDIIAVKNGAHQNPMMLKPYSKQQVKKIIQQRKRWLRIYPLYYIAINIKNKVKKTIKNIVKYKAKEQEDHLYKNKIIKNPVLHGACLIFSKTYIVKEEVVFNPNTFLYFEEDILHYYCNKNGYTMLYSSDLSVEHLEDVSTDMTFKSDYGKLKTQYKYLVDSASVLLELMSKEN